MNIETKNPKTCPICDSDNVCITEDGSVCFKCGAWVKFGYPGTGIELIAKERQEQIEKHGFDVIHDNELYEGDQLVDAALYALSGDDKYYPKDWGEWWRNKMVAKTASVSHSKIERLKIAGALIASEIDRLLNKYNTEKMV